MTTTFKKQYSSVTKEKGSSCGYCGEYLFEKDITFDHKVPLSRGGENTIENVLVACKSCNSLKGTKTFDEFIIHRELNYLLSPDATASFWQGGFALRVPSNKKEDILSAFKKVSNYFQKYG